MTDEELLAGFYPPDPLERHAVAIMIYIDDPADLPTWLSMFEMLGWRDVDYCELRHPNSPRDRISYSPCEKLPEGYW